MGPMQKSLYAVQHRAAEWSYSSGRTYADPFNEVELDVVFADPTGATSTVPAFWAGGLDWRVRFAPRLAGTYRFRTVCSDASNPDLHGQEGELVVTPYEGSNSLYRHGPLRVSPSGAYLEHQDGTPFFWLGDTWWMGLCRRLRWPEDFRLLVADRAAKGFTVIQIVAGLYPDMPPFDERGANEAGFPWEPDRRRINPAYFAMADLRIQGLVDAGLVPCIVGCWGYFIGWMGVARMKQHWRNLIARYGAYPVVWCLAGEVRMPYYLERPSTPEESRIYEERTARAWSEVAAYLRAVDPYRHPLTVHPGGSRAARVALADELSDFEMHQSGHLAAHGLGTVLERSLRLITHSRGMQPVKPIVEGETCYEGIFEANRQEVQRLLFWARMLSGAVGHTYGANGVWQVNTRERPFGPSPHGTSWGQTPWDDAARLPGSAQLGLARGLLERYAWWRFEPHPEWVEPHWSLEDVFKPYAAGIPGQVHVIYVLPMVWPRTVRGLEPGMRYRAYLWNPVDGTEHELAPVQADADGDSPVPLARPPISQDWVLVLERVHSAA
ncbi:MAG: DUF4038 domain-containing protein [Chloroflexi bacterium]|nr:DUF4038 domain-containing protein [Chloroflexota bacterium]